MKKLLLLGLSALLVVSCAEKQEFKLEGKRISIKPEQTSLTPDIGLTDFKVILPSQVSYQDWTQAGGFADHAPLHPELSKEVNLLWKTKIGKKLENYQSFISGPVVYGNTIYTLNTSNVLNALNSKTGESMWKLPLDKGLDYEDTITVGGIAVDGAILVASLGNGDVFGVNLATHKIAWTKKIYEPIRSAPVISNDKVLINTLNNKTYALDSENGELVWTHSGLNESLTVLGDASPAVAQNIVVITYSSGEVYALDVNTGGEIWSTSVSKSRNFLDFDKNIADVVATPVIVGNLVYIVNYSGKLSALNLKTGTEVWSRALSSVNTPWIAGNSIFIVAENGLLASIYRKTGQVKWVVNLNDAMHHTLSPKEKENSIFTAPFLAGNRLIIASNKGFAGSFSPYTGRIEKLVDLKEPVTVEPIVAGKTLYFLTNKANIIAYK